jgi:DnaJ-class molecular chaperone
MSQPIIHITEGPDSPHPQDFCRLCRGEGLISEWEFRNGYERVQVWQACPSCKGKGFGR